MGCAIKSASSSALHRNAVTDAGFAAGLQEAASADAMALCNSVTSELCRTADESAGAPNPHLKTPSRGERLRDLLDNIDRCP